MVHFVVNVIDGRMEEVKSEGLADVFQLKRIMTATPMLLFDANDRPKSYDSIEEILLEFFKNRLEFYVERKNYLEGFLQAESTKLKNQVRFVQDRTGCLH